MVDGEAVPLSVDDVRFQGPTRLLGTEPAPRGVEGDGRLVTGTYALVRSDVRRLITTSAAGHSAIMTTTDHPFWSEDEQDFVNAGDLRRGERVGSRDGPREVTGFGWAWGAHRVHDIEVDRNVSTILRRSCVEFREGVARASVPRSASSAGSSAAAAHAPRLAVKAHAGVDESDRSTSRSRWRRDPGSASASCSAIAPRCDRGAGGLP